jgi:aquaporin Z
MPAMRGKMSKVKASVKSFYCKIQEMPLISAIVAEFIGTFMLVSGIFAVQGQPLYVGFIIAGIVLTLGGAAGIYLNPAMTIGAWVTGKIKSVRAIFLILAQVFGAAVSWLTLNAFLNSSVTDVAASGQSLFHAATPITDKEWIFFFAELLGATIIALGMSAAIRFKKSNTKAALAYGMSVLVGLLVAGWATSMSLVESNTALSFLNPAVAIAANALSWNIWPVAIYILAPALGGIIGFAIQDFLNSNSSKCDCDCANGCDCGDDCKC